MRAVLAESPPCPFLDSGGQQLLNEARTLFGRLGLADRYLVQAGGKCYLVSWFGDNANDALRLLLNHVGTPCENAGLFLEFGADFDHAKAALNTVANLDISDLPTIFADIESMNR